MARRSKAQWKRLIEEQSASELNAAEFCRQRSINAKYFSLRKKQLADSGNAFVRLAPPSPPVKVSSPGLIGLRVIDIELPLDCDDTAIVSCLLNRLLR